MGATSANPEIALGGAAARPARGRHRYLRALLTPTGITGLVLVGVIALVGVLAPLIAGYAPLNQLAGSPLAPASFAHPLGTDEFGRDLLSRVLYGVRVDVIVGIVGVALSAIVGTTLGLVTSVSDWGDSIIARTFDVILAFPAIVLGLAIAAIMSPGESAILVTIILVNVPLFGRLARTGVRQQSVREYVIAARVVGGSSRRVLFRHILPNSVDPLIVQVTLSMATAVYIEAGMSFIGIGIQLPQPSLGNILNGSLSYLATRPTYALGPLVAVSVLMLGLYLIADALSRGLLRR